jgi:diguanylate cyclase (GGDEF)-like protein
MESTKTKLSVISSNTFEARKATNLQHYDISSALQTTLDFSELIHIFSDQIQNLVPHHSFSYHNETFNLEINKGITTRHACIHALKVEELPLGHLKLMRNHPFTAEEITLLEALLCSLIYPLKNATLYKQALNMAFTDALTKTYNRASFDDSLQREINLAHRKSQHLSIIFLDIDHFKTINDNYGHECGDTALVSVAGLMKETLRSTDIVFRYGGEEFVILLNDTDIDGANIISERIRQQIEKHTIAYGMDMIKLTVSLGISSLRGNDTPDSLVSRADAAMYQAKNNGRNRVEVEAAVQLVYS